MKELNLLKVGPVHKNQKEAPKIYKDGLPGLWGQPGGNVNHGQEKESFLSDLQGVGAHYQQRSQRFDLWPQV